MIRFLLRVIATLTLASAVVMAVLDATRSVAASALVVTPLGESFAASFPALLEGLQGFVEAWFPAFVWDPVCVQILGLPGFLVLGVLAFLFYAGGRRASRPRNQWV